MVSRHFTSSRPPLADRTDIEIMTWLDNHSRYVRCRSLPTAASPGRSCSPPSAAAAALGLPATDFDPGSPAAHSLVVGYDLTKIGPGAVAGLRGRASCARDLSAA